PQPVSSDSSTLSLHDALPILSKYGVYPLAWSLDHVGPMTRTVKDAAGLLQIIAGFDPNDPTTVNVPVDDYVGKITGDVKDLVIGDRKSTRLNSSHVSISYAVF